MKLILLIASIMFIYISGKASEIAGGKVGPKGDMSAFSKFIILLSKTACMLLPVFCYMRIFNIAWYWCVLINILGLAIFQLFLSRMYFTWFGFKSKVESYDFSTGEIVRQRYFILDALVTFIISIFLYILGVVLF